MFDKDKTCYWCMQDYTSDNIVTKEHIIPNSIGGRLKSYIMCSSCNSKLGGNPKVKIYKWEGLDYDLSNYFLPFSNIINHNNHHSRNQSLRIKLPDGSQVLKQPGKNEDITIDFKSYKEDGKLKFNISASGYSLNKNSIKDDLVSQIKIDPRVINISRKAKTTPDELLKDSIINYSKNDEFYFDISSPDYKHYNGIIKILLNYYIYLGENVEHINDIKNKIKSEDDKLYLSNTVLLMDADSIGDNIGHYIKLVGSKDNNILYGIVSLYGLINVFVILNDQYNGDNFYSSYAYDLLNNKEIELETDLFIKNLSREEVLILLMMTADANIKNFNLSLKKLMIKIENIHNLV